MAKVHVFCSRPGMYRGGRPNPRHAEYDRGVHTAEQLRELLEEPETTVVIGDVLTEDRIAEVVAAQAEAKAAADAKKKA